MGPHTLMEAVGTTSAWRSCPKDCCEDGAGLVTEVIGLYPSPTHLTQTGVVSLVIVPQGAPAPGGHWAMSGDICGHQDPGRVMLT